MKPLKRVYLKKGQAAKDLAAGIDVTPEQRAELMRAVAETEALTELNDVAIPPPSRERMLGAAYSKAGVIEQDEEDRKMNPFDTLFSGKHWVTRLAISAALVLVVLACLTVTLVPKPQGGGYSLEPAQPALAAQPGYLLAAFTNAEDEQQARAEAEQLASVAKELIELKQGEIERIQIMLDELITELDANQELVDKKVAGIELSKEEITKLEQLEKRLAAKADELNKKTSKIQEVAMLLSDKGELIRKNAAVLRSSIGDIVTTDSTINISSDVVKGENGEYQITLAMPGLSPELADELKIELEGIPDLKDIQMDGVSFIVTENTPDGSDALREINITAAGNRGDSFVRTIQSRVNADISDVKLKEIDGQIAVSIVGKDGQFYVMDGDDIDIHSGDLKLKTYVKGDELDLEELDDLYEIMVTKNVVVTSDGETFNITTPEDMDATHVKVVKKGEEINVEAIKLGDKNINAEDAIIISQGEDGKAGEMKLQTYKVQVLGDEFNDEEVKKLLEEQGIEINVDGEGAITLKSDGSAILANPGDVKKQVYKYISPGEELPDGEWKKILEENGFSIEDLESMAIKVGEDVTWTTAGSNTLSINLEDGEVVGDDGMIKFGWVNDDELGHFVFVGGKDDEFRVIKLKDATVYIGDSDGYKPELDEVRAYIKKHYHGKDVGFKAIGNGKKLEVKLLVDGEVVETLETERTTAGEVVLTHKN